MSVQEQNHNNYNPLFSIIVPMYCGGKYINDILDTVKRQGLQENEFELIIVDDHSPDNSVETIQRELENNNEINSTLLVHKINLRQGGGRNTAISHANGIYIVFLDQDDVFFDNALSRLRDLILEDKSYPDIIAVDFSNSIDGHIETKENYKNCTNTISGTEYMQTQQVPWVPWCYLYKREFVLENKFSFQENCCFEDKDYVIRATVNAKSVRFIQIKLVIHKVWREQQSHIGNSYNKIHDLFWISHRVRVIAEEIKDDDKTKGAVLGHHWFGHKENIKKYLWRLPYRQQLEILKKFPAYTPSQSKFLNFSTRHPKLLALGLQIMRPIMPIVRKVYISLK